MLRVQGGLAAVCLGCHLLKIHLAQFLQLRIDASQDILERRDRGLCRLETILDSRRQVRRGHKMFVERNREFELGDLLLQLTQALGLGAPFGKKTPLAGHVFLGALCHIVKFVRQGIQLLLGLLYVGIKDRCRRLIRV